MAQKVKEPIMLTPEEVYAKKTLFMAKRSTIEEKIYGIFEGKIEERKKPDMHVGEFDIFEPRTGEILYMIANRVIVLFDKEFNKANTTAFVGVTSKLKLPIIVLEPPIATRAKWYIKYKKELKDIVKKLKLIVFSDEEDKEETKEKDDGST
ncbi:MAG: hypothetical protein ACW98F_00160 [Candidatus Hodarchaeales archaeon]